MQSGGSNYVLCNIDKQNVKEIGATFDCKFKFDYYFIKKVILYLKG